MPDSDEMARIMIEISAGWEWGDPRSEVPQTPPNEVFWNRVKIQMKEIADNGGIVDIPSGFPDLTGHREKWPQPPRDADDAPSSESQRQTSKPTRRLPGSRTPKEAPKPRSGQIERIYLAKRDGGEITALYLIEQGPSSLTDRVLHPSGWEPTATITDWRFGERSDIDEITPEEARRFAESVGLGQFVK